MKLEIDLTEQEAKELHTFIRRSIFEDFTRAMSEANQDQETTNNRVYEVEYALGKIRRAIEENKE